jgi:AraC-like DNA-binding protein
MMECNETFSELVRIDGQPSYSGQYTEITSGFKAISLPKDMIVKDEAVQGNYLLLVLEGELAIDCNRDHGRAIGAGQMILFPNTAMLKIQAISEARLLILRFEAPHSSSDSVQWSALSVLCAGMVYSFEPIPIRQPLPSFIDVTLDCLRKGITDVQSHAILVSNFFSLLQGFYEEGELAQLMYPIVGKEMAFKDFVLQNYMHVRSLNELIALSHMGRTTFFTKFKEEFGVTAKQWMMQKLKERILWKIHKPGIRVKELMAECKFESQAQFYRYFRQQFQCTPKQLIEYYQTKTTAELSN